MTKIGFITTSLTSGHAVRGVGFYTKHLLSGLMQYAKDYNFEIHQITSPDTGFDLVHYPFFDPFIHTLPVYKKTKTIVTVHDIVPLEFPQQYPLGLKGKLNLFLQKTALKNCTGIITDSYASVKSIHKYLAVPHYKIKLVYLAAAEIYKPLTVSAAITGKYSLPKKFVLYVGDVNWNKNLPTLIRSCLALNIDLVLVGKQSALVESLDASHPELRHIEELKSLFGSPLVHRLGFVPDPDLAVIYNAATVYCQPSYAEGFGIPVLEAMSCGTPVVCSKSHSLPEIGGDAALYFDPYNQPDLEDKLKSITSDSSLRKSMSAAALVQAKKFSWDQAAKNTLQAYQNFL